MANALAATLDRKETSAVRESPRATGSPNASPLAASSLAALGNQAIQAIYRSPAGGSLACACGGACPKCAEEPGVSVHRKIVDDASSTGELG